MLSLRYERTSRGFDVQASVYTWESTGEVDAQGYFRLHKHTQVDFLFEDCGAENLGGFNGQNVVFGLTLDQVAPDEEGREIEATFQPCYGLTGALRCRRVVVVDAQPMVSPL